MRASDDKTGHKTSAISPAAEPVEAPSALRLRKQARRQGEWRKQEQDIVGSRSARAGQDAAAAVGGGTTRATQADVWSDAQIIAALRECVRLLAPIAADVEVSEPVKREQCGAPAPVLLKRIGSGANKVEISPPAVLNCA